MLGGILTEGKTICKIAHDLICVSLSKSEQYFECGVKVLLRMNYFKVFCFFYVLEGEFFVD